MSFNWMPLEKRKLKKKEYETIQEIIEESINLIQEQKYVLASHKLGILSGNFDYAIVELECDDEEKNDQD